MTPEDPNEIVRLATAANPIPAHMLQEALEGEDIRCRVVGDYLDAGIGDIPGVQAEIWVERRDLERAIAILKEADHPATEESEEPEESEG